MKMKIIYLVLIVASVIMTSSCTGGYSFTGADIDANTKTVTIDYFPNRASLVQPSLSNVFTEILTDKFVSQTNLELLTRGGDLVLEGEITNYRVSAQAYQGNETAALNRLTITIKVKYTNTIDPTKNFDSSFSRYADFESNQTLASVEEELIQQISEEIAVDVFNKAVANW